MPTDTESTDWPSIAPAPAVAPPTPYFKAVLPKPLLAAAPPPAPTPPLVVKKHSHYFKDVEHLTTLDVYRVLDLFAVTDGAIAHAVKKLLVAGRRGAGKSFEQDIKEAVDTLNRRLDMVKEDSYRNQQ